MFDKVSKMSGLLAKGCLDKAVLLKTNVSKKLESFFKKKVYGGGFLWKDSEKLFTYEEASLLCYKVIEL